MKRAVIMVFLFFAAAVAFMFSSAGRIVLGRAETAYYQSQWNSKAPTTYYMEFTVHNFDDAWQWAVTVHEDKAVNSAFLEGPEYDSWFNSYEFTVDSIIEAGEEFCYRLHECLVKFDSVYYYPKIIAIGSRAVQIERFEPCANLESCGNQ
jgi:hypothetical protein